MTPLIIAAPSYGYAASWAKAKRLCPSAWSFLDAEGPQDWDKVKGLRRPVVLALEQLPTGLEELLRSIEARVIEV